MFATVLEIVFSHLALPDQNLKLCTTFPSVLDHFSYSHLFFLSHFPWCHEQQAKAEQEEEFISNTLLKKIQSLKKEKETLAMNYEQEEEFLTNDLSRKLMQVLRFSLFSFSVRINKNHSLLWSKIPLFVVFCNTVFWAHRRKPMEAT